MSEVTSHSFAMVTIVFGLRIFTKKKSVAVELFNNKSQILFWIQELVCFDR